MIQAENLYMNPVQDNDNVTDIDFEKLFNANYKNLSLFIGKRVTHKEDAEDILQSTFFEAMRNHGNFRGNSKPETWMFGIAVNLMRNYFKRQYNVPRMEGLSEVDNNYCDSSSDPNCIVERQDELENILSAIDELPGYAKDIVDLVVDLGCSYQAAADHLDIPIGTVRSRLFRARKILKNSVAF